MRPEFNEIYEILYADYVYERDIKSRRLPQYGNYDLWEYDLLRYLRRSIDSAPFTEKLRPDAKYFLIVNFHCLIIRPLLEIKPYQNLPSYFNQININEAIESDIKAIISNSYETNQNEILISGHQIMISIDKLWTNLRTTKFEIWG